MIPESAYLFGCSLLLFVCVFLSTPFLLKFAQRRLRKDRERFEKSAGQSDISPANLRAIVIVLYVLLIGLIAAPLVLPVSPPFAVLPLVLLAVLPGMLAGFLEQIRRRRLEEQLPGSVRIISNGVRAGMSVVQAIERCAAEAPPPIRYEFQRIHNRWKLGADLSEAVDETQRVLHMPSFTLVAAALKVNRNIGGNLPAILAGLADALESGDQCRRELLSATSEGRSTVKILAAAPFLMLILMFFLDPEGAKHVLTTFTGALIMLLGFAPAAIGIFWARKITSIRL